MSVYINPKREKTENLTRLVCLLHQAQKHGKPNVQACMKAVAQGKADCLEVRG